jgi:hypothetical protein
MFGHEVPRLWTRPLRKLTRKTSRGFEAIEFAEGVLGLTLLPWQKWLLIHMLELRPDGVYRFRTVLVLVARQNGKTTLLQIIALWRMYVDGSNLIIGTAQNLDIAEETWQGAVDMAEAVPELKAEIGSVKKTNGQKTLQLSTGERYKVASASRRGGRGLSGDFVALDELREHQTWDAWGAVTKTTMARARAQIAGFSNAGDRESVVLASLRERAMATVSSGELWDCSGDESLGIFEWSCPDEFECTCKSPTGHTDECLLRDRSYWGMANPSLGYTITEAAIAGCLATDPDAVLLTEVFCRWVDGVFKPAIDPRLWDAAADRSSALQDPVAIAIDVAYPDRDWASISIAGLRPDGLLQVEISDYHPGTEWVTARVMELRDTWWPAAIVVDPAGLAASLVPEFEANDVELVKPSLREVAQACGGFYDAIVDSKTLRHRDDQNLNNALLSACKHQTGDVWIWGRRESGGDISPLVAATLALWGHAKFAHTAAGSAGVWAI